MDILSRRPSDVDEALLKALESASVPESLELEYKGELVLGPKAQRREAARDVSAMANTVGGRILYGVAERILPDRTKVAGPIAALTNGALIDDLGNLLATTIHPRPLFMFHRVVVAGGFVLLVDIRPSPTEVYMVSGYGDNRYYRRSATGVIPMTEPEVRSAYAGAVATRRDLEARERDLIAPEEARVSHADESIFVVPIGPLPLVAPHHVDALKRDIETVIADERDLAQELAQAMKIQADGCRATIPATGNPTIYFAVLKTGVVHWSCDVALLEMATTRALDFRSQRFLYRLLRTLELARRSYERAGYHGPVRIRYILRPPAPFSVDRNPFGFYAAAPPLAPATPYRTGPVEGYLNHRGFSHIAKDLLDPIANAVGAPQSPLFDATGAALSSTRTELPSHLAELL